MEALDPDSAPSEAEKTAETTGGVRRETRKHKLREREEEQLVMSISEILICTGREEGEVHHGKSPGSLGL